MSRSLSCVRSKLLDILTFSFLFALSSMAESGSSNYFTGLMLSVFDLLKFCSFFLSDILRSPACCSIARSFLASWCWIFRISSPVNDKVAFPQEIVEDVVIWLEYVDLVRLTFLSSILEILTRGALGALVFMQPRLCSSLSIWWCLCLSC